MKTTYNPETTFLSVEQVAARYSVSIDSIWRWKRKGEFPLAVKLSSNITRWRLSDLLVHEDSLKACFAFCLEPAV